MKTAILVVWLIACCTVVICWPTGAPSTVKVCETMTPERDHMTAPQQPTYLPYNITLQTNAIRSGQEVQLILAGTKENELFKGFLCQARDGSNLPVGKFTASNGDAQTRSCGSLQDNAVTHTYNNGKKSVAIKWKAEDVNSDVVFMCTIVKTYDVFWTNIRSPLSVSRAY